MITAAAVVLALLLFAAWLRLGQLEDDLDAALVACERSEASRDLARQQLDRMAEIGALNDAEREILHGHIDRLTGAWHTAELYGVEADARIADLEERNRLLLGQRNAARYAAKLHAPDWTEPGGGR